MSERMYLISKAERDLDEVFKGRDDTNAATLGSFLAGPIGGGIGGAITAPKGKKGRAAAGATAGGVAGMVPGAALSVAAARRGKIGLARAARYGALTGSMGGSAGGYRLAVGPKAKKTSAA